MADELLTFKRELERRTSDFAVKVFHRLDLLPMSPSSRVIVFQLGKSASSVGANYREANRAESLDDFIHKLGIVLKECSESMYWLDLLVKLYPDESGFQDLARECDELVRIFQTIRSKMFQKRKGEKA